MAIAPTAPPPMLQTPQPSVVQNAAMATTPQGGITPTGQNFDSLKNDWLGFLQRPEVISGMLQFGASELAGSNIGASLGEAAQAASGTREAIQARGQQGMEEANRQRATAVQERGAAVQEKGVSEEVRANQAREAQTKQAAVTQQEQFTKQLGLDFAKLGVEAKSADTMAKYYGAMANIRYMQDPRYASAMSVVMKNAALAGDPGSPEYEKAFNDGMDLVDQRFAAQKAGAPGAVPPEGAAPPNGGSVSGTGTLPTVTTQQEYDAVPAGNQYLDPQGNTRTKPMVAAPTSGPLLRQPGTQ